MLCVLLSRIYEPRCTTNITVNAAPVSTKHMPVVTLVRGDWFGDVSCRVHTLVLFEDING